MARLKYEVKLYIVRALACFDTPTEVQKSIKENFGITTSLQNITAYDPTNRMGKDLSKDLVSEFHATRKLFKENLDSIPIANKVYRLQKMQNIINSNTKNSMLVLQTLEQAAKEVGEVYTNQSKKVLSGPNGQAIEVNLNNMSESEIDARIAELERKIHEH